MREPMIVPAPTIAPWGCSFCQSATGPLLDTFYENPLGRQYVCKKCARSHARGFGFAPGKRMDELSDAAALLEVKEAELVAQQAQIEGLTLEVARLKGYQADLEQRLEESLGREQTRAHIEQQAKELLAS